ncbi:glycosyltransferase [Gramella sp. AN32]|uniref:Glycosyltransferase n=1 Tax=Christiangramia antarctica TaxID=2058158 RepID=A0ABW5X374_9FLAO|nr:glycosyltransferase [Gramella sp. AN32]MCM4157103.1 hypothetical protein [Gramella sp. AN32]
MISEDVKFFAGFIITYHRSHLILETLEKILNQSFPPEKILIVDNSNDSKTKKVIRNFNNPRLEYYKVGYNSGPAGGSKIGLEKLAAEGFKWIYWGDDNNPPRDLTVFKRMFECIYELEAQNQKVGLFCGKGAKLNSITGRIQSLSNSELKEKEIVEVDVIAGGQTLMINSKLPKNDILPDPNLFFAFEDLDLSLKAKENGFKCFVDSKTWRNIRLSYSNVHTNYRPVGRNFGNSKELNRQYYSTRNLLIIFRERGYFLACMFILFKSVLKIPVGFIKGWKYGAKNAELQSLAIFHFITHNFKNDLDVTME